MPQRLQADEYNVGRRVRESWCFFFGGSSLAERLRAVVVCLDHRFLPTRTVPMAVSSFRCSGCNCQCSIHPFCISSSRTSATPEGFGEVVMHPSEIQTRRRRKSHRKNHVGNRYLKTINSNAMIYAILYVAQNIARGLVALAGRCCATSQCSMMQVPSNLKTSTTANGCPPPTTSIR